MNFCDFLEFANIAKNKLSYKFLIFMHPNNHGTWSGSLNSLPALGFFYFKFDKNENITDIPLNGYGPIQLITIAQSTGHKRVSFKLRSFCRETSSAPYHELNIKKEMWWFAFFSVIISTNIWAEIIIWFPLKVFNQNNVGFSSKVRVTVLEL